MKSRFFKSKFLILLSLFLIGFIVHFKSFQMVPYGDDWTFIYDHIVHDNKDLHINNNYPGIFRYLTPYGPAILSIGVVYQLFGNTYFIYYLIPLILKVLTAFILFLTLQNISQTLKQNNRFTNLLSGLLFLVGFTGIQAIDWAMNMNVYLAILIFALGIFFQSKYIFDKKKINLIASFFLLISSIVIAPTRFTPLIVILPLIDLVLAIKENRRIITFLVLKNIILAILVFFFFQIGIFGNPGQINNASLIGPFVKTFLLDPVLAFGLFMNWIGITIVPIYPASQFQLPAIIGVLFTGLLIWLFYKTQRKWFVIGLILYFIPLFLMWLSSSLLTIEDSSSRHLLVPFLGLSLLIGIIFMIKSRTTVILKFLLIFLILIHIYQIDKIYSTWISWGRGSDFVIPVQEKILAYFTSPITEKKFIFLDFDDGHLLQSIVFGISYRIAVFSGTKGLDLLPHPFSSRLALIEEVEKQISSGKEKMEVINNIYTFQLKNKIFEDVTQSFREELKKDI